jgi:hypothetical protein
MEGFDPMAGDKMAPGTITATLAMGAVLCSSAGDGVASAPIFPGVGSRHVTETNLMNSSSEILRYPTIALVDIVRTKPGVWTTDPSNPLNERREVSVKARAIEYLKGDGPRGDVSFAVTQRRPASGRPADDYGPWSNVNLDARPRLLVFLATAARAKDQTFGSDDNFVILAVGDRFNPKALDDVRIALQLSSRADFPHILRGGNIDPEVARHLPEAGYLLANFVRQNADVQMLDALLERPEVSSSFRQVILAHRMDQLNLADGNETERARVARILLKILEEPGDQARPLQWVISQTHLRNVIFDALGHARVTPTKVFADNRERQAIHGLLRAHPFSNEVRLLMSNWAKVE